ncbi:zinc-ribbon domain-containing protein [Streptomyces olivaceoviridis]
MKQLKDHSRRSATKDSSSWQVNVLAGLFRAKVFHRVRGLARCPACTGRVRYQALAYESPEIAALWHPRLNGVLTPAEVTAGANVPVWWLCPAGHEPRSAQVAQVFMGRQGCPRCRKRISMCGRRRRCSRNCSTS